MSVVTTAMSTRIEKSAGPRATCRLSFDNIAAAQISEPPLTTIAQDSRQAGEALVATLVAKIEEREPGSVLLPVQLVVRSTS